LNGHKALSCNNRNPIEKTMRAWDRPFQPPRNRRLDPLLYRNPGYVYFITIRAFRDCKPFVSGNMNAPILQILREQQNACGCVLYIYCLMPDHIHFLASPKTEQVSVLDYVVRFKGKSTHESWKTGWRGKLWQPRFYDHIVRSEENLVDIANYILENPVRKGLCESADDWQWSGHMNPLPT